MKSLKVSDEVHKELKRFVADNPKENMIDVTGFSIMMYLKHKGHKFTKKKKNLSN